MKKTIISLLSIAILGGSLGGLFHYKSEEKKELIKTEERAKALEKEKALAEKKKIEYEAKLEKEKATKKALEKKEEKKKKEKKEEEDRIAQEQTDFEQQEQAPITEDTVDTRTNDPRSQYYNATPDEIEEGKQLEQQAQDDFWANQDTNNEEISTDETTLSGFINKYGMSPAMYKIQNEGMSEEDALRSTPDSMKTSGEIQLGHSQYGM